MVTDIRFSGFGDRVLLKVRFHGAVRGTAFLIGMPRFNPVTYALTVEDLDFDLRTRGPLLEAAGWLRHDDIVEEIERRLVVRLHANVRTARGKLEAALRRKHDWVRLDGKLAGFGFSAIRFSDPDSALVVYLEAAGRLEARLGG
jgi:hypothetical protein